MLDTNNDGIEDYAVINTYTTSKHKIVTFIMQSKASIGDAIAGIIQEIETTETIELEFNRTIEDAANSYSERNFTMILDIVPPVEDTPPVE